jgi:predicted house-cleaning NTP pyrophosphatase (Maf/HAM1 superfamily)
VDGDYFAVMGLSLQLLIRVLRSLGILYVFGPLEVADA